MRPQQKAAAVGGADIQIRRPAQGHAGDLPDRDAHAPGQFEMIGIEDEIAARDKLARAAGLDAVQLQILVGKDRLVRLRLAAELFDL